MDLSMWIEHPQANLCQKDQLKIPLMSTQKARLNKQEEVKEEGVNKKKMKNMKEMKEEEAGALWVEDLLAEDPKKRDKVEGEIKK
jgi:hypothetical protein